jgi:hypothetical protein
VSALSPETAQHAGHRLRLLLRWDNLAAYPGVPRGGKAGIWLVDPGTLDREVFAFGVGCGLLEACPDENVRHFLAYRLTDVGQAYVHAVKEASRG